MWWREGAFNNGKLVFRCVKPVSQVALSKSGTRGTFSSLRKRIGGCCDPFEIAFWGKSRVFFEEMDEISFGGKTERICGDAHVPRFAQEPFCFFQSQLGKALTYRFSRLLSVKFVQPRLADPYVFTEFAEGKSCVDH